jgi:uncharacterized protein (DUF58 family)
VSDVIDKALLEKIHQVQIRARHLVSDVFAGQYESAFKGRGMEFDEVREYLPGDDVRHIDWNVTARMSKPFVKVHREERDLTVIFLVDVSRSNRFGSRERFKNEIAAEVTALLAYSALRNQDKVGLIVFSDHVEHFLPPKKGRAHVWKLIRDILSYEARAPKTSLVPPIELLNRVQKKHAVVFLISDFQAVEMPKELRIAARRHDLVAVRLWDPRERELPPVGYIELEDAETGESLIVNARSKQTRERFYARRREIEDAQKRFLQGAGVDFIDIDVQSPYLHPIVKFLKAREGRG